MTPPWPLPDGVLYRKRIGARLIDVTPLTYGRARLHIGPVDELTYTDAW